jgi:membrane-bound lytic murein transglycosylase F
MRKPTPELIGTALFGLLLLALLAWPGSTGHGRGHGQPKTLPWAERDLPEMAKDTLRVLVLRDALTWEARPKTPSGLEWELLLRYARWQKLPVVAVPVAHMDSMVRMLRTGQGDIIAAQATSAGRLARGTATTRPYRLVACMKAYPAAGRPHQDDSLLVSAWSPFLDSLGQLITGDTAWKLTVVDRTPEQLLMATAMGDRHGLLVTDATAHLEAKRLPLINFRERTGRSVPLVFVVRPNAPALLHAMDTWLALAPEREAREAVITAYDNGLDTRRSRADLARHFEGSDELSPFDSLFRMHADSSSLDWKLLAAVAWKESRFDTGAVSYMGAGGLMQMMPATAAAMGVTKEGGLTSHIRGASKYLHTLNGIWRKEVPRDDQRLKFVLAAYNAGPGHVKDAQRLARSLGLDPHRWDGNVERAMVLLNRPRYFTLPLARTGYCRGQDVYWYVKDVSGLFGALRSK